MENLVKALQLILFTLENEEPKTILSDALSYVQSYRVGDVIHLVRPAQLGDYDCQYIVLSVKHIIKIDDASMRPNTHILLIEVAELLAAEQSDLGSRIHTAMQ